MHRREDVGGHADPENGSQLARHEPALVKREWLMMCRPSIAVVVSIRNRYQRSKSERRRGEGGKARWTTRFIKAAGSRHPRIGRANPPGKFTRSDMTRSSHVALAHFVKPPPFAKYTARSPDLEAHKLFDRTTCMSRTICWMDHV